MKATGRSSLLVIFLTVFIDLLGFGIVLPLLPIYGKHFAAEHGWSSEQVGWVVGLLMSSFSLMQFLFLPVWGRLSDRFGRRPILIIGLAGSTFFYAMFGVATMWRSLLGLFLSRIGAGIAGATISTAQAYIADTTGRESRAKGMALVGAAFALGFTLGPMIGAVAVLAGGGDVELSPWPGYVAAMLSGIALLTAILWLPESWQPGTERSHSSLLNWSAMHQAIRTPSIALLLLTSFIAVFSFANFESTLSLQIEQIVAGMHSGKTNPLLETLVAWSQRWGYETEAEVKLVIVLVVFSYLGITLTLAQGVLVRRLASRLPEGVLALGGGSLALLGFVLLARAASTENFRLLIGSMAIEVVGFAFINPSLQSLISRRTSPTQQGEILGLGQSCSSLARILGPVCGVRLFTYSHASPYWAATGLMGLSLILIAVAARAGRDYSNESTG